MDIPIAMIPGLLSVVLFALLGLAMGSFLNVCITRLPCGESVVRPRSHCRVCQRPIAAWDNIPLVSWMLLGAKCRGCESPISLVYPAVELTTSALFVMCCLYFQFPLSAAWSLLAFLLLGLAVMDAQTLLLPDVFTLPGLLAGLIFSAFRPFLEGGAWGWQGALRSVGFSLLAASIAAASLLLIAGAYWLARRRMGMGMGDVKLLAMLAAWLGLAQTGLVLFLGVIAGALYGLALLLGNRGRDHEPASQLMVPFGTMLSVAGIYSIFLGERTLHWYLHFFR